MLSPRFIAFYSYKGGVGRSLALANLAYTLAKSERKVLVIDMDLEAPGQHHIDLYGLRPDADPGPGMLDLLSDYLAQQRSAKAPQPAPYALELERYMRVITGWQVAADDDGATSGSLWLMPAGHSGGADYARQLGAFSWPEFYRLHGRNLLNALKLRLADLDFDDVLIDSRTGLSDEFFVTTQELADTVICVTGYNRQNIAGTRVAMERLRSAKSLSTYGLVSPYGPKRLILIGSPLPEQMSSAERAARLGEIRQAWTGFEAFNLELPYRGELALRDVALCRQEDLAGTRNSYSSAFPALAELLALDDPFANVVPKEVAQPENPFAILRKDYFSNEELLKYFVNPGGDVMQDMRNFMPLVIMGARGSGKTMLAGRFALDFWIAEQRALGRTVLDEPPEQIGLYFRIDADFLHTFNQGENALREDFNRLFAQYFDVMVIRKALAALNELGGLQSWCDTQRLFRALYGEFGEPAPADADFDQFADFLELQLQRVRLFLNNPVPERRPVFFQANELQRRLMEHLRRGKRFADRYFVVLLDEYENFADYQQRIVNTRLKHSSRESGTTYRLFMRSGGLRNRETLAPEQFIEVTDDFRQHVLDDWPSWNKFREHMLAVANRHLELQPYFAERGQRRFEDMLVDLKPETEADLLDAGRRNPLTTWVHKHHATHEQDILAWFAHEPSTLRRATAVVVMNQGKPVEEVLAAFREDSPKARDWYHNYHLGALYWLCRLHHQDKRYAGLATVVSLAGFNIRGFLDFCHAIFTEWLKDGSLALPISWEIQDRAIRRQAQTYRDKLRSVERAPEELNNLYERLGRLFEAAHKGPKQSEPEINHFAIRDRLDDSARQHRLDGLLLDAWYTGTLRRMAGTKQKTLADLRLEDWQLNPQYAPLFNLSPRRKKKLILTAEEAETLFLGGKDDWMLVYHKFARRFDLGDMEEDEITSEDPGSRQRSLL